MDDKILISSIKNNPRDGLIEAFRIYGPLVKAIVIKVLGSNRQRDVEECISDTFVKLWQTIDRYNDERGSLKAFIAVIAKNTAIDKYRKSNSDSIIQSITEIDSVSEDNIENITMTRINSDIVKEAINQLPEPDRSIFFRRYFLSEKINEIAQKLELKSKNVEKRLYKGKDKLRKIMIDKGINI